MKPIPFSLRLGVYLAVSFLLTALAGSLFHSSWPLTVLAALFLAALCGGPLMRVLTQMRTALARLNSNAGVEPLPRQLGPLTELAAEVNRLIAREGGTQALREGWLAQARAGAAQEERNRLARDLHDSIKQQLFSIQVSAAAAQARWDSDPTGAQAALADVRQNAQEALTEMNALLAQLSPAPLEKVGLVQALREQCEALAYRTGARVTPTFGPLPPDERLPPGAQESLFRIAQEALSNIARHARAKTVKLYLGEDKENLRLEIEDDGQGFDSNAKSNGMGLANIRQRAEALGGQLQLRSAPGQGTVLGLGLPLTTLPVPAAEITQPDHTLNKIFAVGIAAGLALTALLIYPLLISLPRWFVADWAFSNAAWNLALEVLAVAVLVVTGYVVARGAKVSSRALGMGAGALVGLTAALVMFFALGGSAAGVLGHAELLQHGLRAASGRAEMTRLITHTTRDTLLWTQGTFWLSLLAGAGLGALGGAFAPPHTDSSSDKSWLRWSGVLMLTPLAFVSALAAFVAVAVFTGLEPTILNGLTRDGLETENNTGLMLALATPVFSPLLLFALALLGLHQLYRAELQLPLTTELNRARMLSALNESASHAALAATLPVLLLWLMWATLQSQGGPISGTLVGLVSGAADCYLVAGMLWRLNWKAYQRARTAGLVVPVWGSLTGALGIVLIMGMLPAGAALFQMLNWPAAPDNALAFLLVVGEITLGAFLLQRLRVQSRTKEARQMQPLSAARAVSGLLGVSVACTAGGMLLIPPAQALVSLSTPMIDTLLSYAKPYVSTLTLKQIVMNHYLVGAQVFLIVAVLVAALVSVSILLYWGLTAKRVSGE